MDYYVKWNGKNQKYFTHMRYAYDWCVKMDNKFPSKIPYYCYYRDGSIGFIRHSK